MVALAIIALQPAGTLVGNCRADASYYLEQL
jgi:hypothetical protein